LTKLENNIPTSFTSSPNFNKMLDEIKKEILFGSSKHYKEYSVLMA
jgi:hypothetical protein